MSQRTNPVLQEAKPQDFALWKNEPITRGYYQFLEHQIENWRTSAMDIWESGNLNSGNAEVIRGRIQALREVLDLTLDSIQTFYEETEE